MNSGIEAKLLATARILVVILPVCMIGGRVAVDAALSLTMILFLVRSFMARDWRWTRSAWFRIAVILWLWMLFISLFAFDSRLSFSQCGPWIRFLVFAAALESWVLNEIWMRRLLWVTTATVLFVAGDTWLQYLSGSDLFGHPRPSPERLSGPFSGLRTGVFIDRMMFLPVLGVFLWRSWQRGWAKLALVAMTLFFIGAIYISGERMAFLLAVLGLVLAGLLQKGVLRRLLAGVFALAVMGGVVLTVHDPHTLERHVTETVTTIKGLRNSPYGQIWRSALHLVSNRPLLGVGMKNFRVACDDPQIGLPASVVNRCATHPHNFYLEFLTEAGVPGFLGFIALIFAWILKLWRGWRVEPTNLWLLGPMVAVAIYLWPIGPTSSFFSNWFGVIFWLSLGWALAAIREREAAG